MILTRAVLSVGGVIFVEADSFESVDGFVRFYRNGDIIAEYAANLVKKSVTGAGHADKRQIAMMVGRLLPGIDATADAADALAVAICHAHHRATAKRVEAAL